MKVYSKIVFILMLSFALVSLAGCSEKEKASSDTSKKTTETTATSNKKTTETSATATANKKTQTNPKNEEKAINDFVVKHTKIVKIFNISRRIDEKHPDLGPFFVVRGIDERGQKSEIWIKDLKVYKMIESK